MAEPADGKAHEGWGVHAPATPDPSTLTVQLTLREIAAVKEIFAERFDSINVRIAAMDKAQSLFEANLTRVPTEVDKQIGHVREVIEGLRTFVEEKFRGITTQFSERDTRTRNDAVATKTAVDAAFAAQRDMVSAQNAFLAQALSRIEAVAQRQGEQMMTLLESKVNALDSKISDQKDRLSLIEGRTAGITAAGTTQREQVVTQQGSSNLTLTMVAIAISIVFGIGAMLISFMKS
jgi:hypothetical protein